jgi:anti-sigma factor RsiW
MSCEMWRDKIDAYADGEISDQELAAFDEHLRICHDCAAEALNRIQMKRATRAAGMRFTPPPELRVRIEKSLAPKRRRLAFLMSPALALAVALILVVAVWSVLMLRRSERQEAMSELLDMHVAALASANPVDVVSTDRHTVKPWFQGKLPFTFNLPEMQASQYKLDGGRLVYFRNQPGAQLIYELRKHELSVFIVQELPGTGGRISAGNQNGFSVESWNAGGLHYVILSDAGAGDVHALGELVRGAQR